jgi:FkbM family methyltransferase
VPVRTTVREAVRSAGLLPATQRARAVVQPRVRRNMRDDQHLALLLSFVLRADDNCVDVGGAKGDVLRDLLRLAPNGKHLAFEPLPDHAEMLRREFPGAIIREEALAAEAGTAQFQHVRDRPEYSGLQRRTYPGDVQIEVIDVTVSRLDDVIAETLGPDAPIALVKIDVEGAELGVLQGGLETLRSNKPVVVFEHGKGGSDHYGTSPEDIYDLLVDDVGVRIFDMEGGGPYSRAEFRRVYDAGSFWNFVAHS